MEGVDCVVAGAGVIGLAVARELALRGRDVIVVDAADSIGTETSSRNSEVIHAGIYYRADSLMARFCVEGRALLYRHLEERGLPFRRCGKLIVATSPEETARLTDIKAAAERNGVPDIRLLSSVDARALEPHLRCDAALLSPSTGILDSHAYMLSLQGEAENLGATFIFRTRISGAEARGDGLILRFDGPEAFALKCRSFINSAGLGAVALARRIDGLDPRCIPNTYLAKGNYFALSGRAPFRRLIYPVPVPGGLGVHMTIDLGGAARFGPDVEWVDSVDYRVDPDRARAFYSAVRRYWPDLKDGALLPGYAGIRPKIVPPGAPAQDFVIQGFRDHGVAGLVNLFGIESPGLTASLAIAREVAARAAC